MGCQCSQNVDENGNEIVNIERTSSLSATKQNPQIGSQDLDSARANSGRVQAAKPSAPASARSNVYFVCDKPAAGSVVEVSRAAGSNGARQVQRRGQLDGGEDWVSIQVAGDLFQMRGGGNANECRWIRAATLN